MTKTILNLFDAIFTLWKDTNALKYQKKALKLRQKYNEENDKESPDRNILDHIDRDVMQLSDLINSEVKGSYIANLQGYGWVVLSA